MLINTSKLINGEVVEFNKTEIELEQNLFKPYFAKPTKCNILGYVKKADFNLEINLKVESEFSGLCYKCGENAVFKIDLPISCLLVKGENEYLQFVSGSVLNLSALVAEEILLNFPSVIVCKKNCKGLCGTCGRNLNFDTCNCNKALENNSNNPFGELRKLLNKDKKGE